MNSEKFNLYLTEDPQWREAARHLSGVEDEIMRRKREGKMGAVDASDWINDNIRSLEREYEQSGPSEALRQRMMALQAP
jgi:hypothetical protein